jgi:hypothetical protein
MVNIEPKLLMSPSIALNEEVGELLDYTIIISPARYIIVNLTPDYVVHF